MSDDDDDGEKDEIQDVPLKPPRRLLLQDPDTSDDDDDEDNENDNREATSRRLPTLSFVSLETGRDDESDGGFTPSNNEDQDQKEEKEDEYMLQGLVRESKEIQDNVNCRFHFQSLCGSASHADEKSFRGIQGEVRVGCPTGREITKTMTLAGVLSIHKPRKGSSSSSNKISTSVKLMHPHDFTLFENTCKVLHEIKERFFPDTVPRMDSRLALAEWKTMQRAMVNVGNVGNDNGSGDSKSCWFCTSGEHAADYTVTFVQERVQGTMLSDWWTNRIKTVYAQQKATYNEEEEEEEEEEFENYFTIGLACQVLEVAMQGIGILWGLYQQRNGRRGGLYHNDPHTGNMMVDDQKDEKTPLPPATYNVANFSFSLQPTLQLRLIDTGFTTIGYALDNKYRLGSTYVNQMSDSSSSSSSSLSSSQPSSPSRFPVKREPFVDVSILEVADPTMEDLPLDDICQFVASWGTKRYVYDILNGLHRMRCTPISATSRGDILFTILNNSSRKGPDPMQDMTDMIREMYTWHTSLSVLNPNDAFDLEKHQLSAL